MSDRLLILVSDYTDTQVVVHEFEQVG
jgi:hypothetical protein